MISGPRLSQNKSNMEFQYFDISTNYILKNDLGFSRILQRYLVSPKIDNIGFGVMGTSQNPKIVKMMGFRVFPK